MGGNKRQKNINSVLNAEKSRHDALAPYWAGSLVVLGCIGVATTWIDLGPFWKGYVLDITGPAWNYILFRGLFTGKTENAWTRFFTPTRTLLIFLFVCIAIETAQYLNLYGAVYDPYDFLAYISLLVPLYIMDVFLTKRAMRN
jgi:hypothetical protein